MFNPFKLPEDFSERSLSTKVQYIILAIFGVFSQIFITLAGVSYIANAYFGGNTTMDSVWLWSFIILILSFVIAYFALMKSKAKLKKAIDSLEKIAAEMKKDFEHKAKADYISGKSPVLKKIVKMKFLGEEVSIGVGYVPIPGMDEAEIIRQIIKQELTTRPFGMNPDKPVKVEINPDGTTELIQKTNEVMEVKNNDAETAIRKG